MDITDRKELEKQREAIERELDHRIKEHVFSGPFARIAERQVPAISVDEFRHSLHERLTEFGRYPDLFFDAVSWAGSA